MRRGMPGLWLLSCLFIGGCMNNAGVQDMHMASSVLNGLATIAANAGGGGRVSVPGVLTGAGQLASGTAALAASPNMRGNGAAAASSARLPDTPECRDYLNYASHAGAPGTYSILVDKYHRCLNSASNRHPAARNNKCGPGRYRHYRNGRELCGRV